MTQNILISKDKPAVAAVVAAEVLSSVNHKVQWSLGDSNSLSWGNGAEFNNSASILRFLGRSFPETGLFGEDALQKTEIDHWLNFAYGRLACTTNFKNAINYLDHELRPSTYISGTALTIADLALWEVLHLSSSFQTLLSANEAPVNVSRYYKFLTAQKPFAKAATQFAAAAVKDVKKKSSETNIKKDEGKFVELPGAEMGKVVVRFPPEASGYLHIGHAKAALLNQYYRDTFKGTLIMRFDDTNPAKENAEFEKVILEDLQLLGVNYDKFSHTSDHFDTLMKYCEQMLREGKAYVDDTDPEVMKKEREERQESKSRNNDVAKNLSLWEEMKKGSSVGQKCCVRAKIDMKSDNGCLRDPTMYRCKNESHVRTGTKYKNIQMVIDPVVPRYTALLKDGVVTVNIRDAKLESKEVAKHPKNADVGKKVVWYGPKVFIDGADAEVMTEGETITFINWGNLTIKKINRDATKKITSIDADLDLENVDYKKTQKITWLAATEKAPFIPAVCIHYDHIISKPNLGKDEDFKAYINKNSKQEEVMYGDPCLETIQKGDIIQLQRRGYFICDQPYQPVSPHTGRDSPCVLINIPDGHQKEMPTGGSKHKETKDTSATKESKTKSDQKQKPGQLKKEEKQATNLNVVQSKPVMAATPNSSEAQALKSQIDDQGEKVRQLKSSGADKSKIDVEVKVLLSLKKQYKDLTGEDVPGAAKKDDKKGAKKEDKKADKKDDKKADKKDDKEVAKTDKESVNNAASSSEAQALKSKIDGQGEKVRQLKSSGAEKAKIEEEVKVLLNLKKQYKDLTGEDVQAAAKKEDKKGAKADKESANNAANSSEAQGLKSKIDEQGEKVRQLKSSGAEKSKVDEEVKVLLALKKQYKDLTGEDVQGVAKKDDKKAAKGDKKAGKDNKESKGDKKAGKEDKKAAEKRGGGDQADETKREVKKQTRLGLEASKEENLSDWYSQIITKSELIEYYDVSGCYILRPWAYSIWESIKEQFDTAIKKMGVENCYFPMFVSHSALEKEKTHIADFAPEVAWVTKSGQSDLAEPIAIRPTSETVMYPSFAKWIKSHRDLPLRLNQWCNVVRWEFKHPQPFLRTREFLWQEGHTAWADQPSAVKEVYAILEEYARVYEDLLAIPVVRGRKTEKEKFAGGDFTTTVEVYISASGRAIQGATSHHLGQNFSKMFDIVIEDPETQQKQYVYQNSWGLTTRTIGVLAMVHGDNTGLVLPPRVATLQIVIVPCGITAAMSEVDSKNLYDKCSQLAAELIDAKIRCRADIRDNYSPGWKFNHWELKGVPIRIELGPRDIKENQVVAVRRDTGEKIQVSMNGLVESLKKLMEDIQNSLFAKAQKELSDNLTVCQSWTEFCESLDKKKLIQAPFCGEILCEENIKKDSARDVVVEEGAPAMGAKGLCIPFKQPQELKKDAKCIMPGCPNKPQYYTMFGRSY
uniref:Bifunctional glutamate/proline--tRNA ligase n=1 Tax=Biomphalaria glabrata TaxID=6526 RepID=A0A2C9KCV6_BIOGL